ncbi:MAG: hypothetical protein AB1540_11505 [Bdellovibrionota bacterium]
MKNRFPIDLVAFLICLNALPQQGHAQQNPKYDETIPEAVAPFNAAPAKEFVKMFCEAQDDENKIELAKLDSFNKQEIAKNWEIVRADYEHLKKAALPAVTAQVDYLKKMRELKFLPDSALFPQDGTLKTCLRHYSDSYRQMVGVLGKDSKQVIEFDESYGDRLDLLGKNAGTACANAAKGYLTMPGNPASPTKGVVEPERPQTMLSDELSFGLYEGDGWLSGGSLVTGPSGRQYLVLSAVGLLSGDIDGARPGAISLRPVFDEGVARVVIDDESLKQQAASFESSVKEEEEKIAAYRKELEARAFECKRVLAVMAGQPDPAKVDADKAARSLAADATATRTATAAPVAKTATSARTLSDK